MATVENRLSALESEMQMLKRRVADIGRRRPWLDEVAGSMDDWPEFEEVVRLGREFRQSVTDRGASEGCGD